MSLLTCVASNRDSTAVALSPRTATRGAAGEGRRGEGRGGGGGGGGGKGSSRKEGGGGSGVLSAAHALLLLGV